MPKNNRNLISSLVDVEEANQYLNDMLQFHTKSDFLFALQNVAIAQGGLTKLAEKTGLGRESLYKSLMPHSNPRFSTIIAIIRALGFNLELVHTKPTFKKFRSPATARRNSLAHLFPDIAAQWHPILNDQLTSNDVMPASKKVVWWHCSVDQLHEWQANCNTRINHGCPFCITDIDQEKTINKIPNSKE